jgi:peptide/nickel transport system permease protein
MASDGTVLEQFAVQPEASRAARFRRSTLDFIRHKPLGAVCGAFVLLLIIIALFPGLFATKSPNAGFIPDRYLGPSWSHFFGTDDLGRDLYSRVIYGARTSILIGFGVVALSTGIATVLGTVSGYFEGWIDSLIQRIVDIGIALPGLVFVILFVTSVQQIPLVARIIISVGFLIAMGNTRIIRGAAIAAKANQYVEAARVVGASDGRIIFRHVLPNVFAIILVTASIQIGAAIILEASLSFLGFGVQPPTADWGFMITAAQDRLVQYPHLAIFPGLAIFFTVYCFNMFGDALRDVLDPRLRGTR